MLNYFLLTQAVLLVKDFLSRKICVTLVIIQKIIQKFFDQTNKNVIGKMKDGFGEVICRIKSKMYSMKKIDGKDYNKQKE